VLLTNALSLRPKWRLVDAIDATLTTELGLAIRPFRQQHEDLRLTSWVDDQPISHGTAFTTLPAAFDLPAYPGGEHLAIVQIATPDVLDFISPRWSQARDDRLLSYGTP
jgi:hypothetical protein